MTCGTDFSVWLRFLPLALLLLVQHGLLATFALRFERTIAAAKVIGNFMFWAIYVCAFGLGFIACLLYILWRRKGRPFYD